MHPVRNGGITVAIRPFFICQTRLVQRPRHCRELRHDVLAVATGLQHPDDPAICPSARRGPSIALPVVSSSVSTTFMMLKKLSLKTHAPGFGSLLSGNY